MELDKIKSEIKERYQMIIDYHKGIAQHHLDEVAKWEQGLKFTLSDDNILTTIDKEFNKETLKTTNSLSKAKSKAKATKKGKAKQNVSPNNLLENSATKYITNEDKPMSANDLREMYNTLTGKEISISNFSPRISQLVKDGVLVKCVIEGNPIKSKFLYALKFMLDDKGELKLEYLLKVKAGQIQLL